MKQNNIKKRDRREMKTCSICLCDYDTLISTGSCGHELCDDCHKGYIEIKIEAGIPFIKCHAKNCRNLYEYEMVVAFLSQTSKTSCKYEALLLRQWLRRDLCWRDCPDASCFRGNFKKPGTDIVDCLECKQVFCAKCGLPWNRHQSTETVCQLGEMIDEATREYKEKNSRDCPSCRRPIQKKDGCDHMICSFCEYTFCYRCGMSYYKGHIHAPNYAPLVDIMGSLEYEQDLNKIQKLGELFDPPPKLQIYTGNLFQVRYFDSDRIDVSLIDTTTGLVVADAVCKTEKPLTIEREFLTFANIKLDRSANVISGREYKLRISIGGRTTETNNFTIIPQ